MKHLLWFLEAWLEWAEKIDTGEYDGGYEFDKDRGLCDNADDNFHDGVEGIDGTVVKATLATVLEKEFAHLTGNTSRYHLEAYVFSRPRHKFPFNEGSINNKFNKESHADACHKNPQRLAWVKAKIAELKPVVAELIANEEPNRLRTVKIVKDDAATAFFTVDYDSAASTVCIMDSDGEQEDIFMQGDEADKFNDKIEELYNELRDVTEDEVALHLARPYVENLWS